MSLVRRASEPVDFRFSLRFDGFGEPSYDWTLPVSTAMRPSSAGVLLFRRGDDGVKVLLVHPSGNYNRRAPWSIPKGLPDTDEGNEAAARRECFEETGVEAGDLFDLGFADYKKSRKRIFCFGGEAPAGAEPRCASWEVDRAEFLPFDEACQVVHPDQRVFLERLQERMTKS